MDKDEQYRRIRNTFCETDMEDEEDMSYKGYNSKKEYIEDSLYSIMGDVNDIPKVKDFPKEIQDLIHQQCLPVS